LSQLTKLTLLDAVTCGLPEQSVLPAQLQNVWFRVLGGPHALDPLRRVQLRQLRSLALKWAVHSMPQPQPQPQQLQLAQPLQLAPAVQHPTLLDFQGAEQTAVATASLLAQLPQLERLVFSDQWASRREWSAILSGIAAVTGLYVLHLKVSMEFVAQPTAAEHAPTSRLAFCGSLTGLTP
jgi:hypothetical protein